MTKHVKTKRFPIYMEHRNLLHITSQLMFTASSQARSCQALHRSGALLCHNVWKTSAATQQWQRTQHSGVL